ncbi:MAG: PAS domain-containing protein [Janthinobacterium lividum]
MLAAFGEFAMRSEGLDEVLTEACRLVGEATGTGRAKVLEIQEGRQELLVRAGVGWAPDVVGKVRLQMTDRSSETYAIKAAVPVVSQDIAKDDRFEVPLFMKQAGVVALVNVPIFVPGQRPYGILQVDDTRPRAFGDDEVEFLRTYAMILGPVIDRLHLVEKRAKDQKQLRTIAARHSLLLGSWAQAMWETNADGVVVADSPSWRAHTGQTLDEWLGYGWLNAIHPDDRAQAERQWRDAIEACGLVDAEFRLRVPEGGWRWTNVRAVPVLDGKGSIQKWAVMNIDIDARKRAETALRESEERLRQFGEASQDVLWIRDSDTLKWTYLTPAFEEIYGLSREEALKGDNFHTWAELIVEEDRDHAMASIGRVGQGETLTFEYRVRRPVDGEVRWLRDNDFPMLGHDGRVEHIGGIGQDVTELKRIEEALRDSEVRLRVLMEGVPQLIWRARDDGLWTWASPQWLDYTGQSQEASLGWGWLETVHPDDHAAAKQAWHEARLHGRLDVEYRIRRVTDSAWRWHQTRSVPVRAAPGPDGAEGIILEWLGTTTDIEDLKHLQGQQQVMVAELQHRTRNLLVSVRNHFIQSQPDATGRHFSRNEQPAVYREVEW